MMDKQELWTIIELELKRQISEITSNLDTIEQSKAQETKSSAGDKFETGRAMMQIEEDKLLGQLKRKKEKVLVFGSNGLVGSSVTEKLTN